MSTIPSADAKAVVRAIEQLATQLRRAVDDAITGVGRAVVEASSATQADFALAPTPTDDGPRCVCGDPIELAGDPAVWRHKTDGAYGLDAHTPRPPDWLTPTRCEHRGPHPGFTCAEVDATQPYFRVRWDQEQQAPAADEDAQRTARRHSIRVLLNRLNNGLPLGSDEAQLLTRHVAAEICDANDGRKRAEQAEERLSRIRNMADAWEHRLPDTIRTATAAEAVRLAVVGDYRPVMFGVTPARRDAELEEAQATIKRVRGALHEVLAKFAVGAAYGERPTYTVPGDVDKETFDRWFAALDGTEQPTTGCVPGPYDDCPNCPHDTAEQPTTEPLTVTPCKPPRMAIHCGSECLPIDPSDPERDRADRVVLIGDTLTVITGTPGRPNASLPDGSHYIAEVFVPRGTTEITESHITSTGLLFYRPTTEGN